MGLCLTITDYEEENYVDYDKFDVSISYTYFFKFRKLLLEALDEGLGEQFAKECMENKISENLLERLHKLKLVEFMLHSDCEGQLNPRIIRKTYKAIKNVDLSKVTDDDYLIEYFERLKILMQKALELNRKIIYS